MGVHTYRWDLDKTYLETDFESLRGLVRSAMESAGEKRAVPGATPLLRALGAREGARIFILSGSPTQLREVLEEKLRLDGIRYEGLVLKDSLGHLRRMRVRAIREQLGYKLPVLLQGRRGLGPGLPETLFGDDAEVDALVYSLFADAVAGRLTPMALARIMEAAGAYPEGIEAAQTALLQVEPAESVERIFIRLEKRRPPATFAPLGTRVVPVYSWWQAALVLYGAGHIGDAALVSVLDDVATGRGRGAWEMAALAQDIARRGHVRADVLDATGLDHPLLDPCREALGRLSGTTHVPPAPPAEPPDYVSLVKTWKHLRPRGAGDRKRG